MFNNGNNGGGNPNHASDGKFTSGANQAGNGGNKAEGKVNYEDQIKQKLGIQNDAEPSYEEKMQSTMGIQKPAAEPKKKYYISSTDGGLLSEEPIEASSEEEAFEIASQMYPGRGEELFVEEDAGAGVQNDSLDNAKKELEKYGETIIGENGDRVYSITTDGNKFYGISYRTNYNGPIDGTEEEYDSGYASLEEAIDAMKKSGYPVYDGFQVNNAAPKNNGGEQ